MRLDFYKQKRCREKEKPKARKDSRWNSVPYFIFFNHSGIFLMSMVWRSKNSLFFSKNQVSGTPLSKLTIDGYRDSTLGTILHI
jgi:hypothetical protein